MSTITIKKLNTLHENLEKASANLKSEYEKIEANKAAEIAPFKKAYDLASAKLNIAIKAMPQKVKFDTANGQYILAKDEKTGLENFVIQIRSVCEYTVPVTSKTVEDAYKQVEAMIQNNEVDYESDPHVTLDDVSQNV